MTAVYLHGFASGPGSRKARYFRERLEAEGVSVEVPDLAAGDFENLTISSQMRVIQELVGTRQVRLIGSSMGGYLAALYAAKHPGSVDRMVLLAPAFGFAVRWPVIFGERAVSQWRQTGHLPVFHYGEQRYRNLGVAMLEDAQKWDGEPGFGQPALIFHGVHDTVVPVEASRHFAGENGAAKLVEMDTDHEMMNVLPAIWEQSRDFLLA